MRHYRPVRLPVKYLVKLLVSLSVPCLPRLNLSPGIGWILEKLGMAPKAAEDAVNKINKMKPVELSAEDAAKLKGRGEKVMNLLTPKWKLPKGASDFIDGAGKRFQTLPGKRRRN